MRKILISMLLASAVATPALAGPREDRQAAREQARSERSSARDDRSSAREDRSSAREERAQSREDRRAAAPQQSVAAPPASAQRPDLRQRAQDRAAVAGQSRDDLRAQRDQRQAQAAQQRDQRQVQTAQQRAEARAQRQALREARRTTPPPVSRTPRPGTQPPAPPPTSRPTPAPTWNTGWRNDHRYDWYGYRRRHSWLFNLGFYSDPFGWGYQPYSIGYRMWPSYYSSSFWLNDPWQYRLPYAPPGTRWVRYYDDAILVDTWSGQVVDVIYDFFW